MAAEIETAIWLALKSRLDAPPLAGFAKAWPAAVFAPSGDAFLDVSLTAAMPMRVTIPSGPNERNGTLNIAYVAPINQDASVYQQAAGTIAAHFHEDLQMRYGQVCVRITSAPHVVQGFRDGAWWRTPVIIPWHCVA